MLAHELGHFKLRHVLKRMALISVLSLAFLLAAGLLMEQPWFYAGLGVASTRRPRWRCVLFMFALPAFTFLLQPLGAMLFAQARVRGRPYAAQHASARDLVSALVKLYQDNASTLTPDPLHSAFYDSHPPATCALRDCRRLTP